ncbi:hypothetical protein GCM10010177_75560 [Actinomadura citrea]|nr:hypothetical protein GCM10010177_75560 [Actinomadura citrea]
MRIFTTEADRNVRRVARAATTRPEPRSNTSYEARTPAGTRTTGALDGAAEARGSDPVGSGLPLTDRVPPPSPHPHTSPRPTTPASTARKRTIRPAYQRSAPPYLGTHDPADCARVITPAQTGTGT